MKIEFALLADAAQAVGGKVFVLGGGWNLFRAASYPAPVQLAIAIGLGFSSDEVGIKYPLNVVIADEAGVPVVPEMKGQVETGQPAPDVPKTASVKIPVAININMSLPHPGTYGIVVTAGSSTAQLSFEAIFAGKKVDFAPESSVPERGN
ncbi:MAG: hypothetical protein WBQ86_25440 [Candidatus Binatus sp.]